MKYFNEFLNYMRKTCNLSYEAIKLLEATLEYIESREEHEEDCDLALSWILWYSGLDIELPKTKLATFGKPSYEEKK